MAYLSCDLIEGSGCIMRLCIPLLCALEHGWYNQYAICDWLGDLNCNAPTLAGVVQWIERRPANQRVSGLIPSQVTCLGCGPGLQ